MPLFFWLLDTAIINAYWITKTLGSIQEHKEFRHELVWDLISFANDTDEIQLRNKPKKETKKEEKVETKWTRVTKNFELSDQRLESGYHFVVWKEQWEVCRWCSWLANKKKLDMDRKSPNRSNFWCVTCNVALCCNTNQNCFFDFILKNKAKVW